MALVIHLKKSAQVIINGAVLENASGRSISLAIRNDAAILRGDDIIAPDAANTPASRTYYTLQCAYLFVDRRSDYLAQFTDLLDSYLQAAPSAAAIGLGILASIQAGNLYEALKRAQELIRHEGKVLSYVQERLVEELHGDAAAG